MRKLGLLLCVLTLACSSAQVKEFKLSDLTPVAAITNVETAQKALVIAQDFRVSSVRVIKRTKSEETINQARVSDEMFRREWRQTEHLVREWKITRQRPQDFNQSYEQVLIHAVALSRFAGGS